jgi:hypothetical protein
MLKRTEEAGDDPMDLDQPDSRSNGAMEMDGTNDAVIRETPELESRSPASQTLV